MGSLVTHNGEADSRRWARRRGIWGNRDFVRLWVGESVSLFGSEITFLALPLAAVLTLHASALGLGLLNAVKFAPFILFALPAGAWLDRVRRRPVLIAANLASAGLLAVIPVLHALGVLAMSHLVIVAFLSGTSAVLLHVGFWSYVPSLVDGDDLMDANSKLYATTSAAAVGGPGLGGLLVQALSAPGALLVDAGSFVVATASLVSIGHVERPVENVERRQLRAEMTEGLRFVFANPYLRAFAGEAAMFNIFFHAMTTAFLVYALRVLDMSADVVGAVLAVGAVGTLVGSLAAKWVERRVTLGRAILWTMFLGTWPFLLVPMATRPGAASLAVLVPAYLVSGIGIGIVVVLVSTLRQTVTPQQMMGRMNASYRFVVWGAVALGSVLGGVLAGSIGLHATIVVGAIGIAAAPAWIVWSPVGRLADAREAANDTTPSPAPSLAG